MPTAASCRPQSARQLGLVRKHRGKLLVTARGRAVADDPVALWHQLAERMPLGSPGDAEGQAGLVVLLAIAARASDEPEALAAEVLGARGWRLSDGTPLTGSTIRWLLGDDLATLERIGVLASAGWGRGPGTPTGQGVMFARAALRAWPSGG